MTQSYFRPNPLLRNLIFQVNFSHTQPTGATNDSYTKYNQLLSISESNQPNSHNPQPTLLITYSYISFSEGKGSTLIGGENCMISPIL